MPFLVKHRRFTVPLAAVAALALAVGGFVWYVTNHMETSERISATPESSTGIAQIDTPPKPPPAPATPNTEAQADGAEITPLETAAGAGGADDLDPLEARFDDESVLDAQGDYTLSPEEREKRLKFVKDYFDGLDRGFESIDGNREASFARVDELEESDDESILDAQGNNTPSPEERLKIVDDFFDELDREFASLDAEREALNERVDELKENYFAYIDALAALLSPKCQRRFDEIESHDELTQAEVDGINDELQLIGKELGIEIDDYMQRAAEVFFERFTSLNAAIDKLYERDEQLIKEMEEFTHEN